MSFTETVAAGTWDNGYTRNLLEQAFEERAGGKITIEATACNDMQHYRGPHYHLMINDGKNTSVPAPRKRFGIV